jgi:hypothetical protein
MSTLRSALDELRTEDVRSASDEELVEDLDELERAGRVLEAERARRLVEVERRGTWSVDGHLSVASWLAARSRVGFSKAAQLTRTARALERMPATAAALGAGEVSSEAVAALVSAEEAAPEAFGAAESMLVDAAGSLPARDFGKAVANWREGADRIGAEERARYLYRRRQLHVSPVPEGMVRIDGDLDPECGQSLITALRSIQDAWARDGTQDPRTPAQRRADALGELCRTWLDRSGRLQVAGERPHLVVTMDLESLEGRAGRTCELEDAGPIGPDRPPPRVRRRHLPRDHPRGLRAPGRGAAHPGRADRDAPRARGPGLGVPVPRLRQAPGLVRRPPREALGRRRRDGAAQHRAPVPAAPPGRARGLPGGDGRR